MYIFWNKWLLISFLSVIPKGNTHYWHLTHVKTPATIHQRCLDTAHPSLVFKILAHHGASLLSAGWQRCRGRPCLKLPSVPIYRLYFHQLVLSSSQTMFVKFTSCLAVALSSLCVQWCSSDSTGMMRVVLGVLDWWHESSAKGWELFCFICHPTHRPSDGTLTVHFFTCALHACDLKCCCFFNFFWCAVTCVTFVSFSAALCCQFLT